MCCPIPQQGRRGSFPISLFPYDLVTPAESVGSERLVGASPFFAYPTGLAEGPPPSSSGMLASGSHPASLRQVPPSFESVEGSPDLDQLSLTLDPIRGVSSLLRGCSALLSDLE